MVGLPWIPRFRFASSGAVDDGGVAGLFCIGGVAELKLGAGDKVPLARGWFCGGLGVGFYCFFVGGSLRHRKAMSGQGDLWGFGLDYFDFVLLFVIFGSFV